MSIDTIWDAVAGIALAIAEKIPSVIRTDQYGPSSGPFRSHLPDRLGRDASGTTLAAAIGMEIDRLNGVAIATLRTLVPPCLASRSRRASSPVLITICPPPLATPPLSWLVTLLTGLMFTAAWMLLHRRPTTRDGRVAGRSPDGLGNGLRNGLTVGGWIVHDDPPIGGSDTQMPDGIATDHRTRAISFARWSSLDCHRTAT